jgi:pimeloyl-ACP methyl ester carboxylesterase
MLLKRPRSPAPEDVAAHLKSVLGVIGSPAYPPDPAALKERLIQMVTRSYRPVGTARQLMAVVADGDRTPMLARIKAPTRVIHGQADPLVPVAAAHDLVARIGGAQADIIPGMGHDLPQQVLPRIADGIALNAGRASD